MKYDVFISYSRQDYVDDHEVVKADSPVKAILDFLDAHQISYWFDKEGIYSGSEFVEVIANAIADSKMMLFVSSEHSNESIYTAGEIFEAIENNQLIIPIKIDGSKYNKKFKLLLNPIDYIDFSKNDALTDLLKAVENEKARIAKIEADEALRREELKKREWKKSVKHEIQEQANELQKLKETRNALLASIYKKLRSIDITKKQCPVCESKVDIETDYCQACGWFFPSLSEIEGMDIEVDKSALILAQSRWEKKGNCGTKISEDTIDSLQKEIEALEESKVKLTDKVNTLEQELKNTTPVKRKLTPKYIHAIYIGLIVLLLGGGLLGYSGFCDSLESSKFMYNDLEFMYNDLENDYKIIDDSLNKILSGIDCEPFIIDRIFVGNNSLNDEGFLIYSDKPVVINPYITYFGVKKVSYKIDLKIFHYGTLERIVQRNLNLRAIYKYESFLPEIPLGILSNGPYKVEIWWNNKKLAEKEFVVK